MADLETLQIRIKADADTAYKAIDKLAISLNNLSVSIGRIETGKLNDLASGLDNVSYALKTAKQAVKTSDYTAIFKNFTKLSNIDTARLNNLAGSLNNLASGFTNMTAANSASAYVKDMAAAIAKLGGVKVEAAVTNIPRLESALAHLLTTFSRIPTINQSVIDFVNSLSNLAAQGSHVGPATTSIKNSLESFGTSATRATRKAHSLASVIGTLYAKFWLFARGAKALKNSFVSAADYLEAFNYFDVTARKIGKDTFTKAGVGSAEQYAEAFTKTLQEKLHKMSGLELDLEQRLIKTTNAKSLGLNLTELTQYQASIASITNAMGVSQEVAQSTSKVFSMLAGDIGSLRNMDFSQVSQKLQAGLAGQARALYSFGIDITNATLAEYAYAEGITKSVSEMTQAEKAQLRLLAILDQSKVAWGDLANTINSPSNQLRMLQTNLKEVGTVFGQLFIPIMESALPVINGLALAIKQLMVDIAELLGIKLNLDSFGQFGADIDADIESMDELNKAVKETKKGIREFDELKVIGGDKDAGTGVGDQIDLTKQIIEATNEYEKVWDEAYKRMTSKASEIAAYISGAFEPVKKIIEDFHVGDFFKAGEDVSSLVTSIFNFFSDAIQQVDWEKIGTSIGEFISGIKWGEILKSIGGLIGNAIQGAIDIWKGAFSVAPFETALITAFGLLKFTGLGNAFDKTLVKGIKNVLPEKLKGIDYQKLGLGAVSVGLGLALTIDNIQSVSVGDYNVGDLKFWLKSAVSSLFTGAGFSLAASAIGIASGGLAFGIGAAISLLANVIIGYAEMESTYESVRKVVDAEYAWVKEHNLDAMEIVTNIDIRGEISQKAFDNIDDLGEKVLELSNSYETLTDTQKGELKRFSDELVAAVPGIKDQIDEITGAWKGTADELQNVLDKEKEYLKFEATKQNYQDVAKAKQQADADIKVLQDELEAVQAYEAKYRQLFTDKYGEKKGNWAFDEIVKEIREGKDTTNAFMNVLGFDYLTFGLQKGVVSEEANLMTDLTYFLAKQDNVNESLKDTQNVLDEVTKQYNYWDEQLTLAYENQVKQQEDFKDNNEQTLEDIKKNIKQSRIPKTVEDTMNNVNRKIVDGDRISTSEMNTMFNNINNSFAHLSDGKVPEEVQTTMDNIKKAILENSPSLVNYMQLLKIQMEKAFADAHYSGNDLIWNKNNISARLGVDVGKIEESLKYTAKPVLGSLEDDLKELFGGILPEEIDEKLKNLADTIKNGKGTKAVSDALNELRYSFLSVAADSGMYIDLGLGYSIDQYGRYVYAAMGDVLDKTEDTTMKKIEASSPSRLYRRIGKYIPEGAALGIEDGIPDVKSAIQSMVSVATSAFSNVRYNVPDLGLGSINAQRGFNYGSMDSNNGFVAQMLNMANTAAQNGQTEVVFRVEGDPYGIFKVVREENDKYRRQHSNRSAF